MYPPPAFIRHGGTVLAMRESEIRHSGSPRDSAKEGTRRVEHRLAEPVWAKPRAAEPLRPEVSVGSMSLLRACLIGTDHLTTP